MNVDVSKDIVKDWFGGGLNHMTSSPGGFLEAHSVFILVHPRSSLCPCCPTHDSLFSGSLQPS
jgi:hypothetical protein